MSGELTAAVALALLRGVDYAPLRAVGARSADVLALSARELGAMMGVNADEADTLRYQARERARVEADFIERKNLRALTPLSEDYPCRLLEVDAPPRLLTVCGEADLNAERMLAVVGTRRATPYGVSATESLLAGLKEGVGDTTVVSGLAYGIDAAAHAAALKLEMPTVAVVAHGLGMIYPASHRDLAARMVAAGGAVVTEYLHDVKPYRSSFLERNGVIAAISDAVLVVESAVKGGALSTAARAAALGRPVLAVPGRMTDEASAGTNHLIATQRGEMVVSASSIIDALGWTPQKPASRGRVSQPSLFPELTEAQQALVSVLRAHEEPLTVDELTRLSGLPVHVVAAELSEMEFERVVLRWPGSRFQLSR